MSRLLLLLVTAVAAAALPAASLAHDGHDHGTAGGGGGTAELPEGRILASGLDNPRGLTLRGGAIYVAEAGRGGAAPCRAGAEGGVVCAGTSGAVTRIAGTRQRRIVRGLPSLAAQGTGAEAMGAHDVAFTGNRLHVLVGLGANPAARAELGSAGRRFGRLYAVRGGRAVSVADLAGYEARTNPDRGAPDSNPYGMVAVGSRLMVADAGANALLAISARRAISTVATFGARTITVGEGTPFPAGSQMEMQSVPTSVARGRDGAYYVTELTGLPFPKGAAQVYRVVPGRAPVVFARGLTNVVDVAPARDGGLYVLELSSEGLTSGTPGGRLVHVDAEGEAHEVVSGLPAPGGIAVDAKDRVVVTLNSTSRGTGLVVRLAASHSAGGGHDHGAGGHSGHQTIGLPFGHLPDVASASAANLRRAQALWQATRREGRRAKYATQAAAARAGYRRTSTRRSLPRPTVFHMRDDRLDRDGRQLDARRPESLVYYLPPSGAPVLVAFMYRADTMRPPTLGGLLGYHRHGTHAAAMPMTHVWLTGDVRSGLANCLPVEQLEAALPRFRYAGSQLRSGPESVPCSEHDDGPAHEH
jgi:hypothetical protein